MDTIVKREKISLPTNKKRTLLAVTVFFLFAMELNLFAVVTMGGKLSQIAVVLKSNYVYSAITHAQVSQDSYYLFEAGICFKETRDDQKSINAEILMQSSSVYYSDNLNWNTTKDLGRNDIAVSQNIAQKYHLGIGDKLFSKHISDGVVDEYTIVEILPAIMSVRTVVSDGFGDGLIIMGEDDRYLDGFAHSSVFFSRKSIHELEEDGVTDITDIVYRSAEVKNLVCGIGPYLFLVGLIAVIMTALLVCNLNKAIWGNSVRLITLGCDVKEFNRAYNKYMYCSVTSSIIGVLAVSVIVILVLGVISESWLFPIFTSCVEALVMLIKVHFFRRQLWRL